MEALYAPNQLAKAMASDWFAKMIVDDRAAIFLGGGDQWRYTACWEGSELADPSAKNARRDAVVGGTGAGCASPRQH